MIVFLFRHWKAVTGIMIALCGPMILASWGFILTTSQTNAKIPLHEARIVNLEQLNYRMDERYAFIQKSLEIIQERNLKELQEARQARLANKP